MFTNLWDKLCSRFGRLATRAPHTRRNRRRAQQHAQRDWTPRFEFLEPRLALAGTPHGGDPVLEAEHQAVFSLVKTEDATHVAVLNGEWDVKDTWKNLAIPVAGAKVWIPAGIIVTLDSVEKEPLKTVRIDGTLTFATNVTTRLTVDTIVVDLLGSLIIGTREDHVDNNVTAKIVIAGDKPIDSTWDPNQFSRGILSHGNLQIHGDETTSYVALAESPLKGSRELVLAETPVGWDPGERIVVTGNNPNKNQDEQLVIASVTSILGGKTKVTVTTPLLFNNLLAADQSIYVTNVSRNVAVQSLSVAETQHRGHVMIMHKPTAEIEYAGFYGLGRTDKRNPLHNVELDSAGMLVPGTGKNPVGRYAVHFHRTGLDHNVSPAVIRGSAVVDSPGWGIVNHGSNVLAEGNTVFDVIGAAYVTELGNEIGAFRNNIAVRSTGSGAGIESRQDRQDFGHQGDGFWFQGAGIEVEGNVASGQKHSGYVYFTRGLVEKGIGTAQFLAHNLVDESWAGGKETIDVGSVPIRLFKNNVAFASGDGFESWFHLLNAKHTGRSVIEGLRVWNTKGGSSMFIPYTNQTTVKNVSLLGNLAKPAGTGIGRNDVTRNIVFQDVTLKGFAIGLRVPVQGNNVVQDGHFNNVKNIEVTTAMNKNRVVTINGKEDQFETLSSTALGTQTQINIYLRADFNLKDRDITKLFNPDVIRLGTFMYNGKQLYYFEQAADFVPFKTGEAAEYVPAELVGKTNQQLMDQYGLALGGIVAPANAVTDPKIHALIGDPSIYLPDLILKSRKYTNILTGYQLVYQQPDGTKVKDPALTNLQEGWNLIVRTVANHARTFLVFGDITAPEFKLSDSIKLVINPLDLKEGFLVKGTIYDNSTGTKNFQQRFVDLDKIVQTNPDGSQFVVIRFRIKDLAGNFLDVSLTVVVDPNAPRQADQGFKDLPAKTVSATLLALLELDYD